MNNIKFGEEVMIGALARQVKDGDWAACGTLSPMPAAALWLARLTQAPRLASLHPGVDLEEEGWLTGFEFTTSADIPATPPLDPEARRLLYAPVKEKLCMVYPHFASRINFF